MEEILDTIDKAIKRMVAPTAMIIAAAILLKASSGYGVTPKSLVIYASVLVFMAFLYMCGSCYVALKRFKDAGINTFNRLILSISFVAVYIVLFIIGVALAVKNFNA